MTTVSLHLRLLSFNTVLIAAGLLVLNYYGFIQVSAYLISILLTAALFCSIFLYLREKHDLRTQFAEYFKGGFLVIVTILAINTFFNFSAALTPYISLLTAFLGFGAVYYNHNRFFHEESPNSFYTWILIALMALVAILLRIWNLEYLESTDNYTFVALKNLAENGIAFYNNVYLNSGLNLLSIEIFGFSFAAARLPSIIYSVLSIILLYLIVAPLNRKAAILSVALFSLSPWSIVVSRMVRDYAFDCFVGMLFLFLILRIFDSAKNYYNSVNLAYLGFLTFSFMSLLLLNGRKQALGILIFSVFAYVAVSLFKKFKVDNYRNHLFSALQKIQQRIIANKFIIFFFAIIIIGLTYLLDVNNFNFGVRLNLDYLRYFFDATTATPWHWFYQANMDTALIVFLFAVFSTAMFFATQQKRFLYGIILVTFLGTLAIFVFKYASHLDYNPTRYIYFIFPLYCAVLAVAICYLFGIFRSRLNKAILFVAVMMSCVNPNAIIAATSPDVTLYKSDAVRLNIDNIGIGRYDVEETSKLLQTTSALYDVNVYVFDGRYAEFLLYLDIELDSERFVIRPWPDNGQKYEEEWKYDVGKNTFVESSYFNIHELRLATNLSETGVFVSRDQCITDEVGNCILSLSDANFDLYNTHFWFIKNSNDFRIYRWGAI